MATLLHKLQGARPRGSKSKGNLVRQLSRDTTDAQGGHKCHNWCLWDGCTKCTLKRRSNLNFHMLHRVHQ